MNSEPARDDSASAVYRAIAIMEAVARSPEPQSVGDVIERVGLPKPTVHRLVGMLERLGLVDREPIAKRLIPGARLLGISMSALQNSAFRAPWHAVLEGLSAEVKETCSFSMLYGNEVVVLDRIESNWGLRLHVPIGAHVPTHCTASGKLFLSLMPRKARAALISSAPLKKHSANTITDPEKLEAALEEIRKSRVGVDNEEYFDGLIGVAVPVVNGDRVAGTLSVNAPAARMNLSSALQHVPALQAAARRLSTALAEMNAAATSEQLPP